MLPSRRLYSLLLVLSICSTLFAVLKECPGSRRKWWRRGHEDRRNWHQNVVHGNTTTSLIDVKDLTVNLTFPAMLQHHDYASASLTSVAKSVQFLQGTSCCDVRPNPFTNHIRLPDIIQNISMFTFGSSRMDTRFRFNPTILALPSWSKNEYLLVSRIVTDGLHQESLICEANTCHPPGTRMREDERECSKEDLKELGPGGGLRCVTEPRVLDIPPTPAKQCDGKWRALATIPGFHDPRIFWSGKGEPLIILNSHSQYACLGLWIQDLRGLHPSLVKLLETPHHPKGPLMSYPTLTELTRSPASTRNQIEKNWFLFFPTEETSFLHYDIAPQYGRAFAKLIGSGMTTPNLTDTAELSCLSDELDHKGRAGEWHQASNSLKLLLCSRADGEMGSCNEHEEGRGVHLALMHRKFTNELDLPMRYERHFVIWSNNFPFQILAVSKYPIILANESASGWTGEENWIPNGGDAETFVYKSQNHLGHGRDSVAEHTNRSENMSAIDRSNPIWTNITIVKEDRRGEGRMSAKGSMNITEPVSLGKTLPQPLAYFSYTPSINWARRPASSIQQQDSRWMERELAGMQTGYLDDEIILGIGLDDIGQVFARVTAQSLLSCLRICRMHVRDD